MSKEPSILHRTLIFPLDGAGGELIFRTPSDGNAGSEEFALNIGSAEKRSARLEKSRFVAVARG